MTADFNQIDQDTAQKKATDDMAFTRRTLNTLFNDVNIYSISPVFVFDIARIGPHSGPLGGTRYGPGAGIRLELATTAHFTLGYAWNVRQGPGEGRGNIFFAIGVRDLFH
jgi:hemolysin activation/secretion protein